MVKMKIIPRYSMKSKQPKEPKIQKRGLILLFAFFKKPDHLVSYFVLAAFDSGVLIESLIFYNACIVKTICISVHSGEMALFNLALYFLSWIEVSFLRRTFQSLPVFFV